MSRTYNFSGEVWVYGGESPWHFVTLPADIAQEIKAIISDGVERGFGSVRVTVKVDTVEWATSIFPDNNSNSYLLPIKKAVRDVSLISDGDSVTVSLTLI